MTIRLAIAAALSPKRWTFGADGTKRFTSAGFGHVRPLDEYVDPVIRPCASDPVMLV